MFRAISNLKKLNKFSNFTYSKYAITLRRALSTPQTQSTKLFLDRENEYCYGIIAPVFEHKKFYLLEKQQTEEMTMNWFDETLNYNYRQSTASEIASTFAKVLPFCKLHEIPLTDTRFNRLVDGLMDHAEKLTDKELLMLLDMIIEFPRAGPAKDHNYTDIWTCLDDVCSTRIARWKEEMLFTVASKWYKLGLARISNFTFGAIDKMSKKPELRLSKDQLVQAFFLMNISRRNPVSFEYEHALFKKVEELSVDELAIVALGYFKTQSKVKIPQILQEMLRKAKDAENLHEITLCAILKTVRYTSHPQLADQMLDFLDYITPKLPELSTLCVLHAGLLGTTLQILHKPSLTLAAQRIASNISNVQEVRLKDIERLLLSLTMLDFDPKTTPCIFQAAMQELHEERRRLEIFRYKRCLGAALSFLAIKNIYSVELLNRVLDFEFAAEVYGKSAKLYPRELYVLNMNTYIEVPEYKGPKLNRDKQIKVAKWLTLFTPTKESTKKLTAIDKLILDVHDVLGQIVGGPEKLFIEHVLPHYLRADVIICWDKKKKEFVKPPGLDKYEFGEIMRVPEDATKEYFAVVVVGWNGTVRWTSDVVGLVHMKLRHLSKIGYKPFTVVWNEYAPLTYKDKRRYIEDRIERARLDKGS